MPRHDQPTESPTTRADATRHPVAADGWYWVSAEHPVAIYIGSSYELAARELRNLIDPV